MSTQKFTKPEAASDKRAMAARGLPALDLREAMDKAMAKLTLEDIARVAGCGVNTLRQSRMSPEAAGYRSPPAGLQKGLHELCNDRAAYFAELAEQLRPPKE